jgi:succinoglycan biosynthesis protein ExoM
MPDFRETGVVVIATYRRPQRLALTLDSIAAQTVGSRLSIVVVDNDPAGSARSASARSDIEVRYVHEPLPGIAAARNAGLREARRSNEDFILFIDDDEIASPAWAAELISTSLRLNADIVCGPVLADYPAGTPPWIRRGRFFDRPRRETGLLTGYVPATNNTLVRRSLLAGAGWPQFDEAFSMSGGSDSDFFVRLSPYVPRIAWSDEGIVREGVEINRLSLKWILRRKIRLGNVSARIMLRHSSRPRVFARGLKSLMKGCRLTVSDLLMRRQLTNISLEELGRGVGHIGSALEINIREYQRRKENRR